MERAISSARRVLVVDDVRDSADSLVELLRIMGHDALAAYDAAQAIELTMSYKPDFVFLDIGLPDGDGYTVARCIRRMKGGSSIKLIAHSGFAMKSDEARAFEAGFDFHVAKPMEMGTMRRLLQGDGFDYASHNQLPMQ